MNINFQRIFNFLFFTLCFFSTWIIAGAIPFFQLEGMFRSVDTQVFSLHFLGGLLFTFKALELLLCKDKTKELNNSFFFITFVLGILGLISAFFNDYFYTTLLGSYQIGQGALWYFDLSILILCFSSVIKNSKIKYFFFINVCILTLITTFFTLYPYWKGINISFFYFNDYLCYFGITVFILFTALTKNKLLIILAYFFLGWFLSILDNRAAFILWLFIFLLFLIYH
ncbi:MAG: hypothetical protein VXW97_01160, partial [Pseudomonadota bacterium]|nr:hypothetical protein [Pseudomonadota bacterium]